MQYVSWKTGDKLVGGPDPQKILAKKWTLLKFGKNGSLIKPKVDGLGHWGTYINVADPGNATVLSVRFIRDPKGKADFTGETILDLAKGHKISHTWFFLAKKGMPVAVEVSHNGTKPLVIATREFKAAIG